MVFNCGKNNFFSFAGGADANGNFSGAFWVLSDGRGATWLFSPVSENLVKVKLAPNSLF